MYQIQELNPFLEWHLHATSDDLEQSLVWAKQITSQIARPVRVLDQNAIVIAVYDFQSFES
jgi:trehalose-6-phosphatase